MSSKMRTYRIKWCLYGIMTLLIIFLIYVWQLDHKIQKQILEKRFAAPSEFFSAPQKIFKGQVLTKEELTNLFLSQGFRMRTFGELIVEGDFALGKSKECGQAITLGTAPHRCFTFRGRREKELYFLTLDELDRVTDIFQGESLEKVSFAITEPTPFAQFLGQKPILLTRTALGEIPRYCLDAVLAIEDPQFLTHSGVSVRGIFRAMVANFRHGRWSQGGSTITQQLVKNYFLTPEKTLKRKFNEILISLILELRVSKDAILENYLNIIYLGQQGVFEVRGYGAAARFYFNKPLNQLDLGECSLLAAIVNSPGRYHPIRNAEKAKKRRSRVLQKMLSHDLIISEELEEFQGAPLPQVLAKQNIKTAPYFIDGVKKELKSLNIKEVRGHKIFTTFDPEAQNLAQKAVEQQLKFLTKNNNSISKLASESNKPLEAALVSSHPQTGEITALIGGRHFAKSPFNRAIDGRRQAGSVFKPIVYLTALRNPKADGTPYDPMTLLENSPFKHTYEGQTWEPRNYDRNFSEPVPLFFALKESMNVPTARLAIDVGLDKIISQARELGITSPMSPLPALSLGAFELTPMEILQAYSIFANQGRMQKLHMIKKVINPLGETIYEYQEPTTSQGDAPSIAVLTGMLEETLKTGTARGVRNQGFYYRAAGKTGTTSDTKDAWFAGYTPFHAAVVWVGYDDGSPHGLTGSSGALPIWSKYMVPYSKNFENRPFELPPETSEKEIPAFELEELGLKPNKVIPTKMVFKDLQEY